MSFLNNFFGSSTDSDSKRLVWKHLTSNSQIDELKKMSFEKQVLIFKHSTRCGVSKMVLKNFEANYTVEDAKTELYFLDLLAHRDVSNQVAEDFKVEHQSPQLLIIENGGCRKHASHYHIAELIG